MEKIKATLCERTRKETKQQGTEMKQIKNLFHDQEGAKKFTLFNKCFPSQKKTQARLFMKVYKHLKIN